MERNAVIYYSSNEAPYVKRDGKVYVLGENFSINWKEEDIYKQFINGFFRGNCPKH